MAFQIRIRRQLSLSGFRMPSMIISGLREWGKRTAVSFARQLMTRNQANVKQDLHLPYDGQPDIREAKQRLSVA
jgi:hypothetical protein